MTFEKKYHQQAFANCRRIDNNESITSRTHYKGDARWIDNSTVWGLITSLLKTYPESFRLCTVVHSLTHNIEFRHQKRRGKELQREMHTWNVGIYMN